MPITLTAANCPVPVAASGVYNPTSGGLVCPSIANGDTSALVTKNVEQAGRIDLGYRYGGGIYGLAVGLTISVGAGLAVDVTAGIAIIDGAVVKALAFTITVADGSSARRYLWLQRGGATTHTTTTTAPGTDYVFLGSVVVNAGAQVSVDTAGVMYLTGGLPYRATADLSTPADTPPSSISFLSWSADASKLWIWLGPLGVYKELIPGQGTTARSRLPYTPVNGTNTLTAAQSANTLIDIGSGGGGHTAAWVLELTVAGTPAIPAGFVWEIDNGSAYGVRIAKAGSGAAYTVLGSGQKGLFAFDNSEVVEIARSGPRYYSTAISGTWSPTAHECEADYLYVSAVGAQTLNMPTTSGLDGRVVWVHASESQSALTVQAAGEGNAERITKLLPGEVQPFVLKGDGSRMLGVGRPYSRFVAHEITSDANYTLTQAQYICRTVRINDAVGPTLTMGRDIIMPLLVDKEWFVHNNTAQILTFKGASGTGLAVAAGKHALLYCDGTNFTGGVFP